MNADTRSDRARLAVRTAGASGRSVLKRVMLSRLFRWRYGGPPLEQLLLVPQDLRTADPSFASEIYHGQFGLAGTIALTGTDSPFRIPPPSPDWEQALHGFGWLRHLRAAGDEISREHARTIVNDWIVLHRNIEGLPWRPEIVARRIISWLSHVAIVLERADQDFYDAVMESLARQIRYLAANYKDAPDGVPRLTALTALVFANLCASDDKSLAGSSDKPFADELTRQILSDGGHISRNPGALIDLSLDLLPLRQCFVARDWAPPDALTQAIDRIMPMLRFLRMGDGSLVRFNGMGATPTDALATVLAYDDVQGRPVTHAARSGYCRAELGDTVVVADMGHPPPTSVSSAAGAGCLSFEMSVGRNMLIVNCGSPGNQNEDWRLVARSTAAHSTLVLNDTSSSRFLGPAVRGESPAAGRLSGPANIDAQMNNEPDTVEMSGGHDGYERRYGVRHERRLALSQNGAALAGVDRLTAPSGLRGEAREGQAAIAIRFHLDPGVRAQLSQDGRTALLALPNHEGWRLSSNDALLTLEESVFLADIKGPRRTTQVVLNRSLQSDELEIAWRLERSKSAPPAKTRNAGANKENETLPLE